MTKTESYADAGLSKFTVVAIMLLGVLYLLFFSALFLGGLAALIAGLYAMLNGDTGLWPVLGVVLGPIAAAFAVWRFKVSS